MFFLVSLGDKGCIMIVYEDVKLWVSLRKGIDMEFVGEGRMLRSWRIRLDIRISRKYIKVNINFILLKNGLVWVW